MNEASDADFPFERLKDFSLFSFLEYRDKSAWNISRKKLWGRQNEQLRTWEILRTTLWIVGSRNWFVSLVAKSKLFFSRKFYLLPFEKIFFATFWENFLCYRWENFFATVEKILLATVEKTFFATFWVGFWAYLRRASPCCIFHRTLMFRRLRLGPSGCFILHPVFLL